MVKRGVCSWETLSIGRGLQLLQPVPSIAGPESSPVSQRTELGAHEYKSYIETNFSHIQLKFSVYGAAKRQHEENFKTIMIKE